jgi:hypothetical protein
LKLDEVSNGQAMANAKDLAHNLNTEKRKKLNITNIQGINPFSTIISPSNISINKEFSTEQHMEEESLHLKDQQKTALRGENENR